MKLPKKLAVIIMALALCMASMMPAMAAGMKCSCGSTNTTQLENLVESNPYNLPCAHGYHDAYDIVYYREEYYRVYCYKCHSAKVLTLASREEMSRICSVI